VPRSSLIFGRLRQSSRRRPLERIREGATSRSTTARFAGRSATATLKLFQERGETFPAGVVDRIVLGPEALPDFPQPWASAQDVDVRIGPSRAARAGYDPPVRLAAWSRVRSTPEHEAPISAQNVCETRADKSSCRAQRAGAPTVPGSPHLNRAYGRKHHAPTANRIARLHTRNSFGEHGSGGLKGSLARNQRYYQAFYAEEPNGSALAQGAFCVSDVTRNSRGAVLCHAHAVETRWTKW
jgi:hypothetical protein